MTVAFLDEINELIAEATWEVSDEEIYNDPDEGGSQFTEQIAGVNAIIDQFIRNSREARLQRTRASFALAKKDKASRKAAYRAAKSVETMLSDIVGVMSNNDKLPQGLLIGFREQSESGSEDGIRKIWDDLVDLGLIDIDGED